MIKGHTLRRSPFFYVGDKYKLIAGLKEHFPKNINTFAEPFLGGGSVFLNVEAKHYLLNDIDKNLIKLHEFLVDKSHKDKELFKQIKRIIEKYGLSRSAYEDIVPNDLKKEWVKTYYARFNREGYRKLKDDFNKSSKKDFLVLYLLLIYGFNRMLRFNSSKEFNIPVGNVDFNKNVEKALSEYLTYVRDKDVKFSNLDFKSFLNGLNLGKDDFVYVDPPYLISASEYNKLWGPKEEEELLNILSNLDKKGIKFALSNITHYNGKSNEKLIAWMRGYKVIKVDSNYISYHNNRKKEITEVLITNY